MDMILSDSPILIIQIGQSLCATMNVLTKEAVQNAKDKAESTNYCNHDGVGHLDLITAYSSQLPTRWRCARRQSLRGSAPFGKPPPR